MIVVYMIFKLENESTSTYVTSCLSYTEAENTVLVLNRNKGPDTTFYILNGYRYE